MVTCSADINYIARGGVRNWQSHAPWQLVHILSVEECTGTVAAFRSCRRKGLARARPAASGSKPTIEEECTGLVAAFR